MAINFTNGIPAGNFPHAAKVPVLLTSPTQLPNGSTPEVSLHIQGQEWVRRQQ